MGGILNNQTIALKLIYNSIKDRVDYDFNAFAVALNGWDVIPLTIDKEIIGGALIKGNEIHVGFGKAPKASVRAHIKHALMKVIQQYGSAVTKVVSTNTKGLRFCERLGFVKLAEQNGMVLLECNGSKYVR